MDIYSAEIQVDKLLNYVKGISSSKPRMYQKSKDRLRGLANTCRQVISVIGDILQDEALTDNTQGEFADSTTKDFSKMLNSIESQLGELRSFLDTNKSQVDMFELGSDAFDYDTSDDSMNYSSNVDDYSSSKNESNTVSTQIRTSSLSGASTDRHQAIVDYKKTLLEISYVESGIVEVNECAQLLWKWFSIRFIDNKETFKYNMTHLPEWLRNIVILFAYYHSIGDLDYYLSMFDKWFNSIRPGMNYAVPYEVYHFSKNVNSSNMTLSAVVIWDILLDMGLRNLCREGSSLHPTEDCVYSLITKYNCMVMDPYQYYEDHPEILETCNLTEKVGDSE